MPAELFIDDTTYARIFPRRAARRGASEWL
jgi:hypothetical protein